ncbi:MAG: histidine phosphatase family protein [Candidatus Staskawiczbacteria bacterium]
MKLNNKYYLLRHGQAVSNAKHIVSCWPEKFNNPLTKKGIQKIESVAKKFKNKKIDLIFVSPLFRTQQTAGIVAKVVKIKPKTDKRLRELEFGIFNGGPVKDFMEYFKSKKERVNKPAPKGENYNHILKRVLSFFKEINKKYKNKNILIVSHQAPLLLLLGKIHKNSISESMDGLINITGEKEIVPGQLIELN